MIGNNQREPDKTLPLDLFGNSASSLVTGDDRAALLKRLSPVTRIGKASAPTLVIHGDADPLVPIQQAEPLADRFNAAGARFKLVVKKGQPHGWPTMDKDAGLIADWFDKHLAVGK